jgi:hypothetical protein
VQLCSQQAVHTAQYHCGQESGHKQPELHQQMLVCTACALTCLLIAYRQDRCVRQLHLPTTLCMHTEPHPVITTATVALARGQAPGHVLALHNGPACVHVLRMRRVCSCLAAPQPTRRAMTPCLAIWALMHEHRQCHASCSTHTATQYNSWVRGDAFWQHSRADAVIALLCQHMAAALEPSVYCSCP